MIALCVFEPGCPSPKPDKFGILSLDAALTLAREFVRRGAVVEIHEYVIGRGVVLLQRLEPEQREDVAR